MRESMKKEPFASIWLRESPLFSLNDKSVISLSMEEGRDRLSDKLVLRLSIRRSFTLKSSGVFSASMMLCRKEPLTNKI